MTTCLILAAGEASRHNGGNKALLMVNGETLLSRTLRLTGDMGESEPWVVTHRNDIGGRIYRPKSRRWIVETLLSTMELWSNDSSTTVLLGDVYYTGCAITRIFGTVAKAAAFGNGCNIHALRWFVDENSYISKRLRLEVDHSEKHPNKYGSGKLWRWIGADPEIPLFGFGPDDETTDFDSPQEHKRFIEKYGNRSTSSTSQAN